MKYCRLCGEKYIKHFILHSIYLMLCNMMPVVAFLNFFSCKICGTLVKISENMAAHCSAVVGIAMMVGMSGNRELSLHILHFNFSALRRNTQKTGRKMDKFIMHELNVEWEREWWKKAGKCESSKGRETRSFAISSENFNHPLEANETMQSIQTKPSHKSVDVEKLINKNNNKWRCITHNFSISHHASSVLYSESMEFN